MIVYETMKAAEKITVINPLSFRNTVGGELAYMFEVKGICDFEERLGVKNLVSKEKLSARIVSKATTILGYSDLDEYLTKFQEKYLREKPKYIASYKDAKKVYAKLKCVQPLLRGEFTDGVDILDDILDFFGVDSEKEVFAASESQAALFRKQNSSAVNAVNLHGWLRRGELDFASLNLADYDEVQLMEWIDSKVWIDHIEDVKYFKELPAVLSNFGVGLVLVPYIKNTVYGAVRWFDGKPLIQISDKEQDLASCWFTLFHELGHVIMHHSFETLEGSINKPKEQQSKKEREANKFANKYLFNGDDLRKSVFSRKNRGIAMRAGDLAKEFGVQPIFASYWLRKAQCDPTFQSKVYIDFTDKYQ